MILGLYGLDEVIQLESFTEDEVKVLDSIPVKLTSEGMLITEYVDQEINHNTFKLLKHPVLFRKLRNIVETIVHTIKLYPQLTKNLMIRRI